MLILPLRRHRFGQATARPMPKSKGAKPSPQLPSDPGEVTSSPIWASSGELVVATGGGVAWLWATANGTIVGMLDAVSGVSVGGIVRGRAPIL